MIRRAPPKLTGEEAEAIISEVATSDRQQARTAIANGVHIAREQWLEPHAIAEALALELISVSQNRESGTEVAIHLRALADLLENRAELH